MPDPLSRREALKQLGVVGAGLAIGRRQFLRGEANEIVVAGQPVEISVASLSPTTARITLRPIHNGAADSLPVTGELVAEKLGRTITQSRASSSLSRVRAGDLVVKFTDAPPTITVETRAGVVVQRLVFDAAAPGMSFLLADGPLLGLGEGGPQFDRKGSTDRMSNGQGGYRLATHGTRAPIQWLVGTERLGDVHSSAVRRVRLHRQPRASSRRRPEQRQSGAVAPLDVFVVASKDPAVIMREYARITGLPEMPARWTFGYQQSHRTLDGPGTRSSASRARCARRSCRATRSSTSAPSSRRRAGTRATVSSPGIPTNFPDPKKMLDDAARRALQGRRARRHRGANISPGTVADRVHRAAAAERTHAGRSVAARSPGVVLLAVSQIRDGRRRRRLVARSGRWLRRTVASSTGIACTGRARSSIGRTSGRSRCIATRRPAFSASADSSGRATCSRAGKRSRRTCPSRSTRVFRASVLGHRHRRVHSERRNTPASCSCAGSSSPRSVRCFDRTDATGICTCRGAGTAATAARRRRRTSRPIRPSCTTRRSSRSAGSISSCAIA